MRRVMAVLVLALVGVGCSPGGDGALPESELTQMPVETEGEGGMVTDLQTAEEVFLAAGVLTDPDVRQLGETDLFGVSAPVIWRSTEEGWETATMAPSDRPFAPFQPHRMHLVAHTMAEDTVLIAAGLSTTIKDIPVWRSQRDGGAWALAPDQDSLVGEGFAEMESGPLLVAFRSRGAGSGFIADEWDVRISIDGNRWRRIQAGPYQGRVISSVGNDHGFLVSTDVGIYHSPNGIDWRLMPDLPKSALLAGDRESTVMAVADEGEVAVLQGDVGLDTAQQVGNRLPISHVNAMAVDGDRILLVGGVGPRQPPPQSSVWLWADGEWVEAVESMPGIVRTAAASGDGSWLLGGSDGSGPAIWQLGD